MQDLGKIELRFICYQNWDNSEKMRLASNLNDGRVDGVDAVVESVSFELIPLSASIYKQSQEYSGTSGQQTQQPNQKSKTVRLKINVNNKEVASLPITIGFKASSTASYGVEVSINNSNIKLDSNITDTEPNIKIGYIDQNGRFYGNFDIHFIYSSEKEINLTLRLKAGDTLLASRNIVLK